MTIRLSLPGGPWDWLFGDALAPAPRSPTIVAARAMAASYTLGSRAFLRLSGCSMADFGTVSLMNWLGSYFGNPYLTLSPCRPVPGAGAVFWGLTPRKCSAGACVHPPGQKKAGLPWACLARVYFLGALSAAVVAGCLCPVWVYLPDFC